VSTSQQGNRLSPEFVLLGLLHQHPLHGYELHKQLLDEFGYIWHVSQSQTYNILNRLENQGYITSTSIEQDKLPPRQLLQLTPKGIQHFNEWLESPTKCSVHAIRVEFVTRLYFLKKTHPDKIGMVIDTQITEVVAGVNRLRDVHSGLADDQPFNRLALELRITLLNSILSWLDECNKEFLPDRYRRIQP
jgi:DNA-binding PadR family transcriptional regulator